MSLCGTVRAFSLVEGCMVSDACRITTNEVLYVAVIDPPENPGQGCTYAR